MKFDYSYFTAEIKTENGYYAFNLRVTTERNLLSVFAGYAGLTSVQACKTWKEAKDLAKIWDNSYKANGTYAFQ